MFAPGAATEGGFAAMSTAAMSASAGTPIKRAKFCIFVPPWKSVPDRCLLRWHVEYGVSLCPHLTWDCIDQPVGGRTSTCLPGARTQRGDARAPATAHGGVRPVR